METFVPLIAAAAFAYAAFNLIKLALAGETKSVVTQLASWIVTVLVVFMLQASDFASSVAVGDQWNLATLNIWSTILVGLSVAGVGNFAYDVSPLDTPTLGAGQTPPPYEG